MFPVTPSQPDSVDWELATTVWESGVERAVRQNDELWVHFRALSRNSIGPSRFNGSASARWVSCWAA